MRCGVWAGCLSWELVSSCSGMHRQSARDSETLCYAGFLCSMRRFPLPLAPSRMQRWNGGFALGCGCCGSPAGSSWLADGDALFASCPCVHWPLAPRSSQKLLPARLASHSAAALLPHRARRMQGGEDNPEHAAGVHASAEEVQERLQHIPPQLWQQLYK